MDLSATATKIIVSISLFEKTFNSCLLWNSSLYYDFYKPFVFLLQTFNLIDVLRSPLPFSRSDVLIFSIVDSSQAHFTYCTCSLKITSCILLKTTIT